MTVGIFTDIPHIEMALPHGHNVWPTTQGSGGYLVSTAQYDPRIAQFTYGQAPRSDNNSFEQQRIDRFYAASTDYFPSGSIQYPETRDLHYTQIDAPMTGLLTPSAENSPVMDPQLMEEEDAITCSSMSRGLSPPHSEYASPIYSQTMAGLAQPQWSVPSDIASSGGGGSSHLSAPHPHPHHPHHHHHHHISSSAPYVTPDQVQNYPETATLVPQPLILSEAAMEHPYTDMAPSPNLALAGPVLSSNHHQITHAPISVPVTQISTVMADESRPSSPDEEEELSSVDDSDSDFNPRKRSSPRGKPASKNTRRSKNQRLRQPIYSRNEPTSAADARRNQRGRRNMSGTGSSNRRGRNSMGTESSTKAAAGLSRPFPCPLAPYGCTTTFASKNEWKRHVSTQHVKLGVFRCPLCPSTSNEKSKAQDGGPAMALPSDFNRKDLFTQHVRRMHMSYIWPEYADSSIVDDPLVNAARKANEETLSARVGSTGGKVPLVVLSSAAEHKLQELVGRGYVELRKAPSSCICPLCPLTGIESESSKKNLAESSPRLKAFTGAQAWESRMEHMATAHLSPARRAASTNIPPSDQWARDIKLEEWLVEQGLADMDDEGIWKCRGVRGNGH